MSVTASAPSASPAPPAPVTAADPVATDGAAAGSAPSGEVARLPEPTPCKLPEFPDVVRACPANSAEARAAAQLLDDMDNALFGVADDADPSALNAQLCALFAHPCFTLLGAMDDEAPDLAADSGLAMREFWKRGGSWWFHSALSYTDPNADVWAAPVMLPTLSLETTPQHRLRPFLCSLADPRCGRSSWGWLNRARRALSDDALRRDAPSVHDQCRETAVQQPADRRMYFWYRCIAQYARSQALPHGRFRAPERGWFVIHGFRGHYGGCDGIRAYDLATGAAYVAQNCLGMLIDDDKDGNERHFGQRDKPVFAGRVSTDNLRELVLLLALAPEVIDDALPVGDFERPAEIKPVMDRIGDQARPRGKVVVHSSDQTQLVYRYVQDEQVSVKGQLTWPQDHNSAIAQYLVDLLRVVEDGLVEGCAPADLPASLFDASFKSELRAAIVDLRGRALCPRADSLARDW